VDQYAELGGGQRLLLDIVRHLRSAGYDCSACFPATGVVTDVLEAESVAVHRYALPPLTAGRKSIRQYASFLAGVRAAA